MAGMESFANRSQSLITAIHSYEQQHSRPPDSLNDLVPDYLPAIPETGMGAYPEFEYYSGPDAQERFGSNPWALQVQTPSGGINFDVILYFPNQNYPETGYGGSLQRIGFWAYVHE